MRKSLFLAIIAILIFTSGCDRQPDDKKIHRSTETSTTVAETTAKKTDNSVATKASETTKATTAAKEENESQINELNIDPVTDQPCSEPEPDEYDIYYNGPDYYESDYYDSGDQEDTNYEYDDQTEHVHSYRRDGVNTPHAHHDGYILYVCECGDSYKEPLSCEGYEDHYEFDENMELIEERQEIVETPVGERMRNTYIYQCTICGAEIEVFYEDD